MPRHEIRTILPYEFKLDHNAVEATRNVIKPWTRKPFLNLLHTDGLANSIPIILTVKMRRIANVNWKNWQRSIEGNRRSWSTENCRRRWRKIQRHHSTVVFHLKQIGKVRKLNNYVPREYNEVQQNHHYEIRFWLLLRNMNHSCFTWLMMKNGSYTIIDDLQLSVLTKIKPKLR